MVIIDFLLSDVAKEKHSQLGDCCDVYGRCLKDEKVYPFMVVDVLV